MSPSPGVPDRQHPRKRGTRNFLVLPGEHDLTESIPLPGALEAGEYTVAITLADPDAQRRPFQLAIDAPEKEGRYELSRVKVR